MSKINSAQQKKNLIRELTQLGNKSLKAQMKALEKDAAKLQHLLEEAEQNRLLAITEEAKAKKAAEVKKRKDLAKSNKEVRKAQAALEKIFRLLEEAESNEILLEKMRKEILQLK